MLQMEHAYIPWYIPGHSPPIRCHFECTSAPPGVQVGAIRQQILAQEQQQRDPLDQQRAGPMDVAGQERQHLVVGQGEGAEGLQRNGGKLKKPIQYIIWNLWVDGCNLKIRLSSKRHHPFLGGPAWRTPKPPLFLAGSGPPPPLRQWNHCEWRHCTRACAAAAPEALRMVL